MASTFLPGKPFFNGWNRDVLGSLVPGVRVMSGPGAGYEVVDMDWLRSEYVPYPSLLLPFVSLGSCVDESS